MQRIINNGWQSKEEDVDQYFERVKRCQEKAKSPYTPMEELVSTVDISTPKEAKRAARLIIKRCKGNNKGFRYTEEAKRYGISPITLKKYLIKQLSNTDYEMVSTSRKTIIVKKTGHNA